MSRVAAELTKASSLTPSYNSLSLMSVMSIIHSDSLSVAQWEICQSKAEEERCVYLVYIYSEGDTNPSSRRLGSIYPACLREGPYNRGSWLFKAALVGYALSDMDLSGNRHILLLQDETNQSLSDLHSPSKKDNPGKPSVVKEGVGLGLS